MSKLTLSIDDRVVSRAKRYAAHYDTSVSQLVENFLDLVSKPVEPGASHDTPILNSLRGTLRKADVAGYKRYLIKKYR